MAEVSEEFLRQLMQACAGAAPQPLYPSRYAKEANIDRDLLDQGFDELRRRGLVKLTDWVKDLGQGRALTEDGKEALGSTSTLPATAPIIPTPRDVPMTPYERGEIVREAFVDPPVPVISRILLALNILYFLYGAVYASQHHLSVEDYLQGGTRATSEVVEALGGLDRDEVFPTKEEAHRPQLERIILSSFLHFGWLHLFMNMYFLYNLGPLIEAMWGRYRFLAIYAVATIVSGCLVLLLEFVRHRHALTAGASGSLYGIFAALLVWYALNKSYLPPRLMAAMSRSLTINIFLLFAINFIGTVSWQGHLGGAIGGALAALLMHVQRFHPVPAVRSLALIGAGAVPVVFFLVLLRQAGWIG